MLQYFFKFIFNNKNYVLFKIELIGSISFNCLEENTIGMYDLSKFNIDGRWKRIPPGGLVKEWIQLYSYVIFNNILNNENVEEIQNIIHNYDRIDPIPYELVDTILVK